MTSSPLPPDPYTALSVSKDCSIDQIRSSYRKLVLKAHPDRFPQATPEEKQKKTDEFHKIQQAYELLSDDTRRQRHDERVKLAELKAELLKEQAASRRPAHTRSAQSSQDYSNTRSFTVPTHEHRAHADYEVRVPKTAPKKAYEEEAQNSRYDSSSKFEDYRASPRSSKHEDAYKNDSRRTSARAYDELRRDERDAYEEKRAAKERMKQQKERESRAQAEKKKSRDKGRRQASETKQYYSSPIVNDYTDSNSSEEEYRRSAQSSRKKTEGSVRRSRDERTIRRSRDVDDHSDYSDERSHDGYYQRQKAREQEASNYIRQAQKQPAEVDERRGSVRGSSRKLAGPPPAPPPPPPMASKDKEKADSAKRSSATRKASTRISPPRESRSSRKERAPEIVDPDKSRRSGYDTRSRPPLKPTESAPPNVDPEPRHLNKASTWQTRPSQERERERERERDRDREREKEPARASIKRASTTPLESMVNGYVPPQQRASHGASRLNQSQNARELETDSEPESPAPNGYGASPAFKSRSYFRYTEEPEEIDGPRIVGISPDYDVRSPRADGSPRMRERPQSRDVSPKRPPITRGSGSQRVPQRSNTYTESSSSPRASGRQPATLGRSASNRADLLFGEVEKDDPRDRPSLVRTGSATQQYKWADVHFSPPIDTNNIQYSSRRRSPGDREKERGTRGSDRERSRERKEPSSSYPGFSRHAPSNVGRQTAGKAY